MTAGGMCGSVPPAITQPRQEMIDVTGRNSPAAQHAHRPKVSPRGMHSARFGWDRSNVAPHRQRELVIASLLLFPDSAGDHSSRSRTA
jgi:hypothetical protein